MNNLVLGNIIAFVGAAIMAANGLLKSKKSILLTQCVQFGLLTIANLLFGGISGAISDALSLVRNLVAYKRPFDTKWKIIFTVALAGIGLGVAIGNGFSNAWEWLPVFAGVLFTWFLDSPDEVVLKVVIIFAQMAWATYDIHLMNYSSLLFDVLTFVTNAVGIVRVMNARKKA